MYEKSQHGHLLIAVFSEHVTLDDHRNFAADVAKIVTVVEDLYVIGLMKANSEYPQSLSALLEIFQLNARSMKRVTRYYGLKHHPVLSFVSAVIIKLLDIDSKTVEAATIEELIKLIKADAEKYPNLKASLFNWDTIEAAIEVAGR